MSQHSSLDEAEFQIDAARPRCMTPSTLRAWSECPLKALFVANKVAVGLPRHAQAILGSISHAVCERVRQGGLGGKATKAELDLIWQEEVAKEEASIGESPVAHLELPLLPLSESCARFERHRLNTLGLAASLRGGAEDLESDSRLGIQSAREAQTRPGGSGGTEEWVMARGGTVGGYIESLLWRDGKLTIRDYKTGAATADNGDVKPEYIDQLLFYAALCHESSTIGRWPELLEIIDKQGNAIAVSLDTEKANDLLERAAVALQQIHWQAESVASGEVAIVELARPRDAQCHYCAFRPKCPGYRSRLREEGEIAHDSGSVDLAGRVTRIEQYGRQATLQLDSGRTIGGCVLGPGGDSRCNQVTNDSVGIKVEFYELRALGRWKSMLQVTPRSVAVVESQ